MPAHAGQPGVLGPFYAVVYELGPEEKKQFSGHGEYLIEPMLRTRCLEVLMQRGFRFSPKAAHVSITTYGFISSVNLKFRIWPSDSKIGTTPLSRMSTSV